MRNLKCFRLLYSMGKDLHQRAQCGKQVYCYRRGRCQTCGVSLERTLVIDATDVPFASLSVSTRFSPEELWVRAAKVNTLIIIISQNGRSSLSWYILRSNLAINSIVADFRIFLVFVNYVLFFCLYIYVCILFLVLFVVVLTFFSFLRVLIGLFWGVDVATIKAMVADMCTKIDHFLSVLHD